MKVVVKTVLDAPVERIWAEVKTPALLRFVAAPLVIFDLIDPPSLPPQWRDGRYLVRMRFLGLIPLGRQWIVTRRRSRKITRGACSAFVTRAWATSPRSGTT